MYDVSIIIPTFRRPTLLRRAILSCIEETYGFNIEVIVIPNGSDSSWRDTQAAFKNDSRIKFFHENIPDQNNARNLGISLATGEFIRFLDDDDYLFPAAAAKQYAFMRDEILDFCSANALVADHDGSILQKLHQPNTPTPEAATLSSDRLQLPFTHVYRRTTIQSMRWKVGLRQSEDIEWLIRYASIAPRRWKRIDVYVGAWYQHMGARQSLNKPSGFIHETSVNALFEAYSTIEMQSRMTSELALLIAEAILELAHRAFPFRPIYWTMIAGKAISIDEKARPRASIYRHLQTFDPRLIFWMLLPKRIFNLCIHWLRYLLINREYRRTL